MLKTVIALFLGLNVAIATTNPVNNYFSYDNKVIDCSDFEFRNYVLPQVKNIISEFYLFLRKVDPINNDLVNLKLEIQSLFYTWDDLSNLCAKDQIKCNLELSSFYKQAGVVDRKITALQSQQLLSGSIDNFMIDNRLFLTHTLYELANLNYRLVHKIERLMVKTSANNENISAELRFELQPVIQEMKLTSELMLASLMGEELRDNINFVYMNFIKLLEDFVVRKNNKDYLVSQLEATNIAWNTFHMKMTKGLRSVAPSNMNLITTMHNRWVGILKVVLDK